MKDSILRLMVNEQNEDERKATSCSDSEVLGREGELEGKGVGLFLTLQSHHHKSLVKPEEHKQTCSDSGGSCSSYQGGRALPP